MVNYLSKWLKNSFFLEEIKAQREKEFNLLESTGLEAPNFTNSKHLETWLEWDGEFDSMLKEWIFLVFRDFLGIRFGNDPRKSSHDFDFYYVIGRIKLASKSIDLN